MNSSNLPSYSIIGNGLKNQSDTSVSFGELVMSFSKMTFFAKKFKLTLCTLYSNREMTMK